MTDWIWDASALHHAAAADRLDVLLDIAKGVADAPSRHLTTSMVADELARNGLWSVCEPHFTVVEVGKLDDPHAAMDEIQVLVRWLAIVSSGQRSRGEATVFAWAEINRGTAIIDDGDARRAARRHGLVVHGTLWILLRAVEGGTLTPAGAEALVVTLRSVGARLPSFPAGGTLAWARQNGALTQ